MKTDTAQREENIVLNVRKNNRLTAEYWYVVEPDVWQGDRIRFMHVLKKCRKVWIMSRLKSGKRLHIQGNDEWVSWIL